MRNIKTVILVVFLIIGIMGCSNKPINAEGMGVIKVNDDTLCLILVDSYYKVKKYTTQIKGDTLFIEVLSIKHYSSSKDILIPIESTVKTIKLQNDKTWNIDSIDRRQ